MKNSVILILIVGVIVLLLLRKCDGGGQTQTITYDTVFVKVKSDTVYIPKPYETFVDKVKYRPVFTERWDTLYLPELIGEEADTLLILAKYFQTNKYSDTSKNKYGKIIINDEVTQNRIAKREIKTDLVIPEVTKTITLTQPKRNQVYLGAGIWGSEKDVLGGYEVNLSLKNKQDRIIGIGYQQLFNAGHYYKLEYRHKISFRK
jgi:hypothetical protein